MLFRSPYPKNPLLANFFVQIGRADTLGSGVRNLYKFTKIYSGGEPELIDGDVFMTIVPLGKSVHSGTDSGTDSAKYGTDNSACAAGSTSTSCTSTCSGCDRA